MICWLKNQREDTQAGRYHYLNPECTKPKSHGTGLNFVPWHIGRQFHKTIIGCAHPYRKYSLHELPGLA